MESGVKRAKCEQRKVDTLENGKRQKVENLQQMKMKNKRARGV